MNQLKRLFEKPDRFVVGLMSGTSLDGVDAVLARLAGSGRELEFEVIERMHAPYPSELHTTLLENSAEESSSVHSLSQLNVRLAHEYAGAVGELLDRAEMHVSKVDLIGSHGQTVHHVPDPDACAGVEVTSTLQLGDPSVLANLLRVPVVGDFRMADMACGGQGAPLVPYFDYVAFSHPSETRGLLNLGGIANLTILPADASIDDVQAFDTGPANMVMDQLAQRCFGKAYDTNGDLAAEGQPDKGLVADLLEEDYFLAAPPKSTGRERFGSMYADRLIETGRHRDLAVKDILATATALTAYSVYQAYARFFRDDHTLDRLLVSGGGLRNNTLMQLLSECFSPIPVQSTEEQGVDPDVKEALCFAVLAHETINGVPTNVPASTGADRPTMLGKICVPT